MKNSVVSEINAVFELLSAQVARNCIVVRESLERRASALAVFGVYDRATYKERGAKPIMRYALYPVVGNPDKIGSVAIYAPNAVGLCVALRTRRSLFGRVIESADVELGRRPFVDVKFAA